LLLPVHTTSHESNNWNRLPRGWAKIYRRGVVINEGIVVKDKGPSICPKERMKILGAKSNRIKIVSSFTYFVRTSATR